ncbi:L,D-transpeptidase family protein [Nitriliruptoraceae bacterium ZYF776]|nr:L,D-transpeptidase family protein [Profundirhabdus halotolerans]
MHPITRVARPLAAAFVVLHLAGCASPEVRTLPAPETPTSSSPATTPADAPEPSVEETGPTTARTTARASGPVTVHDGPDGTPAGELPATTGFGSATTLLVVDASVDGWLEVVLPVRPNGTTGWVRTDGLELREVTTEVRIDLDARQLEIVEDGEVTRRTTVAVGDAEHPTPTGTFSVTDKVASDDPYGPYGPFAIGLSGRSEVLTEFAGGDGQIAIHGTDRPDLLGEAVSHGCIRVHDEVATWLAENLPLGTPVTVS